MDNKNLTSTCSNAPEKLSLECVQTLFLKFKSIWAEKWTRNITSDLVPLALSEWGEGLRGLTPQDLKFAIDHCRENLDWPPSIAEFRNIAKSRTGKYADSQDVIPRLEAPREQGILTAQEWLAKIKANLPKPK